MRALLVSAMILFAGSAVADDQDGWFIGVNYAHLDANFIDSGNSEAGVAPDGVTFRTFEFYGGMRLNTWLGFDTRIGTGLSDEVVYVNDTTPYSYKHKIQHYEAIYYRPELANQTAKLYGLIGVANVASEGTGYTNGSGSQSQNDAGFSWGAGIGFVVNERFNFNMEYRSLLSEDDAEYTSIGAGIDLRF